MSDPGSETGAASRPHVRSGAVSVAAHNALTIAYITHQVPCSNVCAVRIEVLAQVRLLDSRAQRRVAIGGSGPRVVLSPVPRVRLTRSRIAGAMSSAMPLTLRSARYGRLVVDMPTVDSFVESASGFAQGALRAHGQDPRRVALEAGTALEHLAKAALAHRSPVLLAETQRGNFSDLLQLLGFPRSGDTRPLRTIGLRGALDRIEVFVAPRGSRDDLRTLADMRDGTAHAAMDDEVETRLLATFVQYADKLLKDLGRDRAEFWDGQIEVVDALLTDASERIGRDVAVKLAQARAFFTDHYGGASAELIKVIRRVAEPRRERFDQMSAKCPVCESMGLVTGTSDSILWVPDAYDEGRIISSHEEELFIPSAFECRVCNLRLNSIDEIETVGGFDRWTIDSDLTPS